MKKIRKVKGKLLGIAPTLTPNSVLVCHWCHDIGIAKVIEGDDYLRTYTGTFVKTLNKSFVFIYRNETSIYDFSGKGTHTITLAVGDRIWDDTGTFTLSNFKNLNGISFIEGDTSYEVVHQTFPLNWLDLFWCVKQINQ